jgi:hypothetical protein
MQRRYDSMVDLELWAVRMVRLLDAKSKGQARHFRWHDSGDLQSRAHLDAIVWIAKCLPHIQFWLPTKEYRMVTDVEFPINLTVRLSAPLIGEALGGWAVTSSVGAHEGFTCPASTQGNACGDCRACWDISVSNIDYPLH